MSIKSTIKQIRGDYSFGGLDLTIPEDPRNFSLLEFGGVSLGKAPDAPFFVKNIPPVKDQYNTDFCVGAQSAKTVEQDYVSQLDNFQKHLSMAYVFAMAKKRYYGGDYSGFGLGITMGLGTLQHDGICLEELWPLLSSPAKRNYMANARNIPEAAHIDAQSRKMTKGYFQVDVFRDKFDNFSAGLYHWNEFIITGMYWYQGFFVDFNKHLILDKTGSRVGHCISAKGFDRHPDNNRRRMWFANSYVSMPDFWLYEDEVKNEIYNGYIVLPFSLDVIEILKKYTGKAIMSDNTNAPPKNPNVYLVVNGEKRKLVNEMSAWSHKIRLWRDVVAIPDSELSVIPTGEDLSPEDGEFWTILQELIQKYKIVI